MTKRGFSMIELILYAGLLSIILAVITNTFLSIVDLQLETESFSGVSSDGQFILARLNYDLPRATQIVSPALGGSSGTLTVRISGVDYTYARDSNNNLTINPGGQLNSFQTEISDDLLFIHLGTGEEDTVRIKYTLTSKTARRGNFESKTFQTTVGLRPN